jgi:hypothetical protein
MSFFYKELNFPPIPEEILKNMITPETVLSTNDSGYGYKHQLNGVTLHACGYNFGKVTDAGLLNWLKENIPEISKHLDNTNAGRPGVFVQTQTPATKTGTSTHIVHTDVKRVAALNYHWELGGDNVTNRWYQEKGKPVLRPKTRPGIQTDTGKVNYRDLEVLDEVKTKAHCWYMLNTAVLHDVQNIESRRQGLTICFENAEELDLAGFAEHP